jgi:hypothetical protein
MRLLSKKIIVFLIVFLSIFTLFGFTKTKTELHEHTGPIEHLALSTLIAFPERALDIENNNSNTIDETKITPSEFTKILKELYENNYILISVNELFFIENNTLYTKPLLIPKNKKPLILSFDNVTYKSNYQNLGQVDKIIIDRNNEFATYTTKRSIQDRITHDNEFIPLLESFIKEHPDFSFNSARGIIFLTGENGILGYETNLRNTGSKHDIKRVTEVVSKLKTKGWIFGCNNYRYIREDLLSDLEFVKELSLWQKEVRHIVGDTPLYAYPYGFESKSSEKHSALITNGFKVFFTNSHMCKLELKNNALIMSRKVVNGKSLRETPNIFNNLFDAEEIYDHLNRRIPYHKLQN